jgi:hypothetical protein
MIETSKQLLPLQNLEPLQHIQDFEESKSVFCIVPRYIHAICINSNIGNVRIRDMEAFVPECRNLQQFIM